MHRDGVLYGYIVDEHKNDDLIGFLVFNLKDFKFEVRENNKHTIDYTIGLGSFSDDLEKIKSIPDKALIFNSNLELISGGDDGLLKVYLDVSEFRYSLYESRYILIIDFFTNEYYVLLAHNKGYFNTRTKELVPFMHHYSDFGCFIRYTAVIQNMGNIWDNDTGSVQIYMDVLNIKNDSCNKQIIVPSDCNVVITTEKAFVNLESIVFHKNINKILIPSCNTNSGTVKFYISKDTNIIVVADFLKWSFGFGISLDDSDSIYKSIELANNFDVNFEIY